MTRGEVRVERRGAVAVLTLDRTGRRNAIDEGMLASLDAAVDGLGAAMPRAVVIAGAGDAAFCAGQDVNPDNPQVAALMGSVQAATAVPPRRCSAACAAWWIGSRRCPSRSSPR